MNQVHVRLCATRLKPGWQNSVIWGWQQQWETCAIPACKHLRKQIVYVNRFQSMVCLQAVNFALFVFLGIQLVSVTWLLDTVNRLKLKQTNNKGNNWWAMKACLQASIFAFIRTQVPKTNAFLKTNIMMPLLWVASSKKYFLMLCLTQEEFKMCFHP